MWETPKVNWATGEAVGPSDFNRIEGNSQALRNLMINAVYGFDIDVSNQTNADAGIFSIGYGECALYGGSGDALPVAIFTSRTKNLNAYATGSGQGAKAAGSAAYAAGDWWYVFLLYNSVTGAYDYAIDSEKNGTNAAAISGYDKYQAISTFQISELSGPVYGIVPIISRGDSFYYMDNRSSVSNVLTGSKVRFQKSISVTTAASPTTYTESLVNSSGHKLVPPMTVEALGFIRMKITYAVDGEDIISVWGGVFSNIENGTYAPAAMLNVSGDDPDDGLQRKSSTTFRMPVSQAGTYKIMAQATNQDISGAVEGYVHGFVWDRRSTN